MRYPKHIIFIRSFRYSTAICLILLCLTACIKEDLPSCDTTLVLEINAIDAMGQNINSTGEAGNAQLYIFDKDQRFVQKIEVAAADIKNKIPVQLLYKSRDSFWVVIWSNLNGNQKVSDIAAGTTIEQALIELIAREDGYVENPDDLFFGITNIEERTVYKDVTIEESITIKRKTALINIIVKGLDAQLTKSLSTKALSDYHFVISGDKKNKYNFKGALTGNPIEYKQGGQFNLTNTQFISSPFRIFPVFSGGKLIISIYKGDKLIAVVEANSDRTSFIPIVGVTTNILIDLRNLSNIGVNIKVTDWDEEYHSFEW